MTNITPLENTGRPSVLAAVSSQYGMDPARFEQTLRATVFPREGSPEQFAAFLLVCREHGLNPITKEVYAFPTRGGGVQPIVSIDGWLKLVNSRPEMDGMTFEDIHDKKGDLAAIKCRVYRKDRTHPIEVVEYISECRRNTETWRQWPARMLRHKATIQAARYAFGFSGIIDPDEWERHPNNPINAREPIKAPPVAPAWDETRKNVLADMGKPIEQMTADEAGAELDRKLKESAARQHKEGIHGTPVVEAFPEMPPALDRRKRMVTVSHNQGEAPVLRPATVGEVLAKKTATPADPELFLKELDEALSHCGSHDDLMATWELLCPDDVRDQLFPPDQDEAIALYDKHERRLEP